MRGAVVLVGALLVSASPAFAASSMPKTSESDPFQQPTPEAIRWAEKLDRKQEITLAAMEQDKKDALAYIDPTIEKKDTQAAFQKYYQIITFGSAPEMANVRRAQILKQEAIDGVYTLHEFLIIEKLRRQAPSCPPDPWAVKKAREARRRECATQLDLGKRRGKGGAAVAAYTAAISACGDLLRMIPNDAEATANLAAAKSERFKLVGDIDALEDLKKQCQTQMDKALAKFSLRSPKGFQDSIKEYDKVVSLDSAAQTEFPAKAQTQITVAKKKLSDAAAPFVRQADAFAAAEKWLEARKCIRQAIAINPYDLSLDEKKDHIEREYLKNEAQQLQSKKVYLDTDGVLKERKSNIGDFGTPDEGQTAPKEPE